LLIENDVNEKMLLSSQRRIQKTVLGGESWTAEGVEGEMYEQEFYPLLSRLGALGERRKLPQSL